MARGGMPVAAAVSRRLAVPLDVIVVRKIGHPARPELGLGAIAEGDVMVLNEALIEDVGIAEADLTAVVERERAELLRRVLRYRAGRAPLAVAGRDVILVDDGLATGYTARAAIATLRSRGASSVTLAVPVAAAGAASELRTVADRVVVLEMPSPFIAVGAWYADYRQTSDDEVVALLVEATG